MEYLEIFSGIWKLRLGAPEEHVPSAQRFVKSPQKNGISELPPVTLPFSPDDITFSVSPRGCLIELPMNANEDVYGLGLQLKSLVQTGKKRILRVNSDPVADTGDSHAPAPLYFSTSGYGVMVDTARYATFYTGGNKRCGNHSEQKKDYDSRSIALNEEDLYSGRKSGLARMMIEIPVAQGVDIYVFGGPKMLDAVRRYVLYSGGGCMPPEWGLGIWYRCCGSADQSEVISVADELREKHIPCDVLGLEPGWQSQTYSCSFKWSEERFPEHEHLIHLLDTMGYKINLWEHAFVHPTSPMHESLKPYSGDFEVWDGLVPDFATEKACKIFGEYHQHNFTSENISSFKLDECDNSDFIISPWSFPECSRFPSGMDGEQMHSLLGMLYQDVIETACRKENIRTYGSARCSHLFAPSMPFVLYSDLYDHKDFIRGVVNCGFSGMLWTPELRHAVSTEDYLRRLQAMVLSPQMLLNIWSMPHPPWYQLDREKNREGIFYSESEREKLLASTRKILKFRQSFIPYLYSAFAIYHFEGIPPFRALAMDYPDCDNMRDIDYAWMAGPDLMVIPFTADTTERTMPLPPGNWYDFYTGQKHSEEIYLNPDIHTLPILVRENCIIPVAEPLTAVTDGVKYELQLRIYGKTPQPVRMFADDGISLDYQKGKFAWGEINQEGIVSQEISFRYEVKDILRFV